MDNELIKVSHTVEVVEPVEIRTHWVEDEEPATAMEELALVEDPHAKFQEWIETDFEELTDYQREFVQRYFEYVNGHEDLAVKPKDPKATMLYAAMQNEATKQQAKDLIAKVDHHTMSFDPHGSKGGGIYCTCGASKQHPRVKVLNTWAWRHHSKTGHEMKKS